MACGIQTAIDCVHAGTDGDEQEQPSPDLFLQQIFADEAAEKQEHDDVNELEGAHGLQADEIIEVRAGAEEEKCRCGDEAKQEQCATEPHGSGSNGRDAEAGEGKEDQEWEHDAQPLVPCPRPGEEKVRE